MLSKFFVLAPPLFPIVYSIIFLLLDCLVGFYYLDYYYY